MADIHFERRLTQVLNYCSDIFNQCVSIRIKLKAETETETNDCKLAPNVSRGQTYSSNSHVQ